MNSLPALLRKRLAVAIGIGLACILCASSAFVPAAPQAGLSNELIPPLRLSEEDFKRGFHKTFQIPNFTEWEGEPEDSRSGGLMLREQTFEKLYSLKLHGMAQGFEQQLANPDSAELGFEERFAMLVEAQWLWRENQAIKSRLRKATLKMPASIEDINYRHARQLERSTIRSLANCDWIRQRHNIAVSGPSGIGKTYICCALLD